MCSWCWGFNPVLEVVSSLLPDRIPIRYVMGGLARDSQEPIDDETRAYIQSQWRNVAERTGAIFNWDFWDSCMPKRSTYPACRAVIAAGMQRTNADFEMFQAIQRAYYVEARNPAEIDTLIQISREIQIDPGQFSIDLIANHTDTLLHKDFELRRSLEANKFPTMILEYNENIFWLAYGYEKEEVVVDLLNSALLS